MASKKKNTDITTSVENNEVESPEVVANSTVQEEQPVVFKVPASIEKFRNYVAAVTKNEKFANSLTNAVQSVDYAIDLIIHPKAERYERGEVVQASRPPIVFGTWVIIVTFGFFGMWASFAPLNKAATAEGKLVSESFKKSIQHPEGGIIEKINVKEGDKVKKGDLLIKLDETKVKGSLDATYNALMTLKAQEARLLASRDDLDSVQFDSELLTNSSKPEIQKIIDSQLRLFNTYKEYSRGSIDVKKKKIEANTQQITSAESRKTALEKQLSLNNKRLADTRSLVEKGYSNKLILMDYEAKEAELIGTLGSINADISRLQQEINAAQIDILSDKSGALNKIMQELKDTQLKLSEVSENYKIQQDMFNRLSIVAPYDGIVHALHVHTIGGVIPPGSVIMEIVPIQDKLIIEALVKPQDIDRVDEGMVATIRLAAFKSRTTPPIDGKVIFVAADIQNPDPSKGQQYPHYLIRVELDKEKFDKDPRLNKLELWPGMPVQVSIVEGTRTLLKYLLDPLTDSFRGAFTER